MSQPKHHDEVSVLDKRLGQRLAYFIRQADGVKIDQPDSPWGRHIFAAAGRELVVLGADRVSGNYLLKLYQELCKYVAEANYQSSFEEGVEAIAGPLRQDLVSRLAVEQFWLDDGASS